jgi:multidrug efflux pump
MSKQILPWMNIEWTDLSFQQATQGNTALIVFPVAAGVPGAGGAV